MTHRTVAIGAPELSHLVTTELPPRSHLVRLFRHASGSYDRMIVVTEEDARLLLQGWIGDPLSPATWRTAKAALFPDAAGVRFERRKGDGLRLAHLPV